MSAGTAPPGIFTYQLVTGRNAKNKPSKFFNVTVTASICLDFAHPRIFSDLPERPTLVLGPARTWEQGIAVSMWEQALGRVDEIGSTLLWCDGGDQGISGVAGNAVPSGDIVQVGPGSWVRAIGLKSERDDTQTIYARTGPWLWVVLAFGLMGTVAPLNQLMNKKVKTRPFRGLQLEVPKQTWRSIVDWWHGQVNEEGRVQNEETSLLG